MVLEINWLAVILATIIVSFISAWGTTLRGEAPEELVRRILAFVRR